jgi:hypothetical protein
MMKTIPKKIPIGTVGRLPNINWGSRDKIKDRGGIK